MNILKKALTYINALINDLRLFLDNNVSLTAWFIAIPYVVAGVVSGIAVVIYSKLFLHIENISFEIYSISPFLFLIASPLFFLRRLAVYTLCF